METKLGLILLALIIFIITIILIDIRKLFTRNLHKLDPKYMNDTNTVKGTKLELDEDGNTIIIPTKRYKFDRYL